MSEMLDRVAAAIGSARLDTPFEDDLNLARAAIEAMREPTEAMVADGWNAAHSVFTNDRCNHEMLREAYRAMNRAALKP
jgi:hypothetical protein